MKKSQLETLIREVIRETIRKVDGKYVVYPEKGGKRLGTHSTKKAAEKQLTTIHLNKENYADGKGKYIYIGTCMNSFDDYGECKHNAFYDEEHFFNSWNAADEISKEEFWSNIDPSSDKYQEVKKYEADPKYTPEYRYSPEDDIYYIFINDDTHYFFVNPDTLRENYADGKVKGKSRPGRVKRSGASCKGSVTDLRAKAKKYGGEKGKMYHWCANMKGGKK